MSSDRAHWDHVTAAAIDQRVSTSSELRFFDAAQAATVDALALVVLGPHPQVPVTALVDHRLARGETDGWRHEDLPEDGSAWCATLGWLDVDARDAYRAPFAHLTEQDASSVVAVVDRCARVRRTSGGLWHGVRAAHVWSLWTRYVCAAFYSHPAAWAEISFPGPAYPRGYGNLGLDSAEPWERER